MRILFLNPVGNLGGAEQALLTAIAGIRKSWPSADVHLIAGTDGPLLTRVLAFGARAEVLPMSGGLRQLGDSTARGRGASAIAKLLGSLFKSIPDGWDYLRRLRTAIRRINPTLVHTNGIKCHLLSALAVDRSVPVVWWAQDFFAQRVLAGNLLRLAKGRCRLVLAISKAVALDAQGLLPNVPITTLPHAVDLQRFKPGDAVGNKLDELAALAPAPANTIRVGLVATYARWKGQLTVLDAAARLAIDAPELPVRWYIIGGPIYHTAAQFTETELREATATRELGNRVGFVPFVADPVPIYRALDVVVHASTQPEPFGLTIAEAMACGRPVVVSQAGGAAELFTDGIDALGCSPGDATQLATVVRRLVEDAGLRVQLGDKARQSAERQFDSNQYGDKLCQVYRTVLAKRSGQ